MRFNTARATLDDRWYRPARLGLWLLILLLALRFAFFVADAAARPSNGFVAYYVAARLVKDGADVGRFYDDAWFRSAIARYGPAVNDIYNVSPPTTALLLLPLAGFSYAGARSVWTLFNLVCLVGVGVWLMWQSDLRGLWVPSFAVLMLAYQPLYANFAQGQAYVLLLAWLVVAWYGYRHQRAWLLGISLGLMLVFKTAGVLLWPLLLIRRRWRALVWGTLTVLVVSLASLPWLGLGTWRTYFRLLPRLSAQPEMAVTAYQTQLSFFRHLFTFDERWNPAPLLHAPALGTWLPRLGIAAVAGISAYAAYTTDRDDLAFAAFAVATVLLSPVSLDYHYTLLLLPIAILVAWVQERAWSWPAFVLGISAILIAADLPYQSPRLAAGALALLAYPKLYGAFLLWGLAVWACRRGAW